MRDTETQPHGFALQVNRSNGPQGSTRVLQGQARRTRDEKKVSDEKKDENDPSFMDHPTRPSDESCSSGKPSKYASIDPSTREEQLSANPSTMVIQEERYSRDRDGRSFQV